MGEEPSLETLWLRNIGTMDKVQKIDFSNGTPVKLDSFKYINFRTEKIKQLHQLFFREILLVYQMKLDQMGGRTVRMGQNVHNVLVGKP
jgi:hypothetical protein